MVSKLTPGLFWWRGQLLHDPRRVAEYLHVICGESANTGDQRRQPTPLRLFEHPLPARGCLEHDRAAILGMGPPADQLLTLQSGHDAAHRWRGDLLGLGEFTQRARTAGDKQGERREARDGQPGPRIFAPQSSQQMHRCAMEPVRDILPESGPAGSR